MPVAPLMLLDNVSLRLDGRAILQNVAITSEARRVAVLGRNGSGKTTLARVMAGLQAPTSGTVRIAGVDVARDRRGAMSVVGILFQNPDHQIIFPTVQEELSFGLKQMGFAPDVVAAKVAGILDQFGKTAWTEAAIHQLSQGQRQLVCLMAILAMAPRLIILDEPFAGLDIPTSMHLVRVLDRIDTALVHITHDPQMIAGYEHAIWMESGAVVEQGEAGRVAGLFEDAMRQKGAQDDLTHLTG